MPSSRRSNVPGRTGHVAPDDTLGPSRYVAHIEGTTRVIEEADEPFDTVEEAVAWAAERAPTVLVRTTDDNTIRWAGEHPMSTAPDMARWRPGQA